MTGTVIIQPLAGMPEVSPGDDLADLLIRAIEQQRLTPSAGDILVVTQKVVSKAEGRYRRLASVEPSTRAHELVAGTDADPRFVELVLQESERIVRQRGPLLIVSHRNGHVMANAGIDRSNLEPDGNGDTVLLLPEDADATATKLREKLEARFGGPLGAIISDSFGRPWRLGVVGFAIGADRVPAVIDRRGELDRAGRKLETTVIGFADAIAAAAVLAMGEADEATPAALVSGLAWLPAEGGAAPLVRPPDEDLFR